MDEKSREGKIVFLCLILAAVIALFTATQYTATKLSYQEALGPALYDNGDFKVYLPFAFLKWAYLFREEVPEIFLRAYKVLSFSFFICCIGIFVLRHYLGAKISTNYGSARWATVKEVEETGLLDGKGIFLGAMPDGRYLRENDKTHDLIVAPTRGGKGVTIVQPTCFTWPHSLFIIDPKAEAWGYTAGWREKQKNKVFKFHPAELDSCHFNPFDEIRFGTGKEFKDADNIAKIQCDPTGMLIGTDKGHWAEAAAQLLTAIILHIKYTQDHVCPDDILEFMTSFSHNETNLQDKLLRCTKSIHDPSGQLMKKIYKTESQVHPRVRRIFTKMALTPEKEFGSIASTLETALNVYNDPIVAENTRYSDFAVKDLVEANYPVSVYFVVSPDDLDRLGPIMRMMVEIIYRRNVEKLEEKKKNKRRLLLLIDEFPALGRLANFEKALAFIAGYGIKSVLITQGLNQINRLYTEHNSIFDNAHVRVFFTPNDRETPKFISEMLGSKTIRVKNKSFNGDAFKMLPSSIQENETGRELMTRNEVSTMDAKNSIIFVAGHHPIFAEKITWYEDENFKHKEMPAPAVPQKTDEEVETMIGNIKNTWREKALQTDEEEIIAPSEIYTDTPELEDDEIINPFV